MVAERGKGIVKVGDVFCLKVLVTASEWTETTFWNPILLLLSNFKIIDPLKQNMK